MRLTRVRAWNFKSFRELDIRLDGLNIVIGANASGKSNFVQLFSFIRDIVESGLENAVSIQGGVQYLRTIGCAADGQLAVELCGEGDVASGGEVRQTQQTYRFSLRFDAGGRVSVSEDELQDSSFNVMLANEEYRLEGENFLGGALVQMMNERRHAMPKRPHLLIEAPGFYSPFDGLRSIATYDINPKASRVGMTGAKSDLEADASNLAFVLARILSESESRRMLLNLLTDILPFAEDLETKRQGDGSLFFYVREKFSQTPMPSAFLSDGTIDIVALIAILYFERKSLVVIEEPDRNLHPSLMSTVVEFLKDASGIKQIIVTTHNPEVVRYAEPGQLILISRDVSGSSHASRPADRDQVKRFLSQEISMHELYVENLLEV